MIVCGIDFETTGLDFTNDRITEIGAVLFDTSKNWEPIATLNDFVYEPDYPKLTEENVKLTGITEEMLKTQGISFGEMLGKLCTFAHTAKYFIAHNKHFDRRILIAELDRHLSGGKGPEFIAESLAKPWLCSAEDLKPNRQMKCWKLSHLALDYGVAVDPSKLHRAVADVLLMGEMLAASKVPLADMIKFMQTPSVVVRIDTPGPWEDGGKGVEKAKELGFKWEKIKTPDGEKVFPKQWVKLVKEDEIADLKTKSQYRLIYPKEAK